MNNYVRERNQHIGKVINYVRGRESHTLARNSEEHHIVKVSVRIIVVYRILKPLL